MGVLTWLRTTLATALLNKDSGHLNIDVGIVDYAAVLTHSSVRNLGSKE